MMHFFETTDERRQRFAHERGVLNSYVHGQSLCGNGSAHQRSTREKKFVTCKKCLDKLEEQNS